MGHGWLKGTTKCTNGDIAQIGEPIEAWLGFDQIPHLLHVFR